MFPSTTEGHLTVKDLTPLARELLEAVYQGDRQRRTRCSREDYYSGWVAALERYGITEPFNGEVPSG